MSVLDLNLLVTFDALYELRSTTLAAERLALSQSAISHALRRLRDVIGDPLFVRGRGTLLPTARALEMAPEVREGLAKLRAALASKTFDPSTARRTLTIAASAYFCSLLAPELIAWARADAPNMLLRFIPLDVDLPGALEDGTIDLAVGTFDRIPERYSVERLFRDGFVWIAATDNPLALSCVTRETIDRHPKLQIRAVRPFGIPSNLLAGGGIEVRPLSEMMDRVAGENLPVHGILYDTATAIEAVARSDLLAQVPRRMVERLGALAGVVILDTVETEPTFDLAAVWHHRSDSDLAAKWLLTKLRTL